MLDFIMRYKVGYEDFLKVLLVYGARPCKKIANFVWVRNP